MKFTNNTKHAQILVPQMHFLFPLDPENNSVPATLGMLPMITFHFQACFFQFNFATVSSHSSYRGPFLSTAKWEITTKTSGRKKHF